MEHYLGELKTFAYNKVPKGWLPCDGRELPVQPNQALYSLFGNKYGGKAPKTFALPNLSGRVGIAQGKSNNEVFELGKTGGIETVQLGKESIPAHTHEFNLVTTPGTTTLSPTVPVQIMAASVISSLSSSKIDDFTTDTKGAIAISPATISSAGESSPHENRQPYLVLQVCICVAGDYPPFS